MELWKRSSTRLCHWDCEEFPRKERLRQHRLSGSSPLQMTARESDIISDQARNRKEDWTSGIGTDHGLGREFCFWVV